MMKKEKYLKQSELVTRVAVHVISDILVNRRELLDDERIAVAHAFLQRVTSTHMCNHKLTDEGLVFEVDGEAIELHEAYKTMTLTRTVYEHLAMFYFLYEHPKTDDEREFVWKYWSLNSGKTSGCFEATLVNGKYEAVRLSYSQAWKYLFRDEEMSMLYSHLSMHCHPVYSGLMQYQTQAATEQDGEGVALYLSTCFVAYLCRLFLKLIPDGYKLLHEEFSERDIKTFRKLAKM